MHKKPSNLIGNSINLTSNKKVKEQQETIIHIVTTDKFSKEAVEISETVHDERFSSTSFLVNTIFKYAFERYSISDDIVIQFPNVGKGYMASTLSPEGSALKSIIVVYPERTPHFNVFIEFEFKRSCERQIIELMNIGCTRLI